uniref:Uncharacterized protein n=1 Tax=viral metagenome TaxID=1070528 RepID=A0A6C0D3X7_9ZZZZ
MPNNIIIPYSATAISVIARFIFMYLLYTKKSTNDLSLLFCIMNITSSTLWIQYSIEISDFPILIRGSSDLLLFSLSSLYIISNKLREHHPILPEHIIATYN